jgi:hypothetical protein
MISLILLSLAMSWWQEAESKSQPIISATNPAYLGCTTWTGHDWSAPTARSARTPTLESPKGLRAYAEVEVVVQDGSCENTTKLYVAPVGGSFRAVYSKTPSASDGNGIRLIGWSPNGDKLLAEVTLWKYETDLGYGHLALIYDAPKGSAKEIATLDKALDRHFGTDCEFELAVQGWKTDGQLLVKISRTPESDEYEQHFCVKDPQLVVFDLTKETVDPARRESKKKESK